MTTISNLERETSSHILSSSPCIQDNTIYLHANPSNFRYLVQKYTGVPNNSQHNLPISYSLQERRRDMKTPAMLEIPFTTGHQFVPQSFKLNIDHSSSPVSTMDHSFFFSSNSPLSSSSPSPNSFVKIDGPFVVLSKEEEEREEKAIKEKRFYLHNSSRGITGIKPKLLSLFPVASDNSVPGA